MIMCGFYMCLLLTEHLIGCKLDTGEQLKRKSLCYVRSKTVSHVANKMTFVIKMYVLSINWATGVCINFVRCEHSIL
jgi:hypothetical protein